MEVSLVVQVITYLMVDRKAPFFIYMPDYKII